MDPDREALLQAMTTQGALTGQHDKVLTQVLSSLQELCHRCCPPWSGWVSLCHPTGHCVGTSLTNFRRPLAPPQPGQRVWSPSKDLPLQVELSKLALWFMRPSESDLVPPSEPPTPMLLPARCTPSGFWTSADKSAVYSSFVEWQGWS